MSYVERKCPLCNYLDVPCEIDQHGMWLWYQCPNCNWFGISALAESKLKDLPNNGASLSQIGAELKNTLFLRISLDGATPTHEIENRTNWRKAPPK